MGRRGNGEGYVFQLATGNWAGQLMDGYKEDGKKNIVCFYASTRGEVLQKMRRYKQAQEDGTEYMETDMSFSDWADAWYEDYKTQVQPSTYSNYRFTLKTLSLQRFRCLLSARGHCTACRGCLSYQSRQASSLHRKQEQLCRQDRGSGMPCGS